MNMSCDVSELTPRMLGLRVWCIWNNVLFGVVAVTVS